MSEEWKVVAILLAIVTTLSGGGALYVSMRVSGSISNLRNELVKELDDRYVRKSEHAQSEGLRDEVDANRRASAKEKLDGIEVELHRYRDDLAITLKGILAAINDTHTKPKQRT